MELLLDQYSATDSAIAPVITASILSLAHGNNERAVAVAGLRGLNADLFHWESQSATSMTSPTGRRYLNHRSAGSHVVMFTRLSNRDDYGLVGAYTCLGQADYAEHGCEKPIAFTWHLRRHIPAAVLVSASAVAR
ncbi:DUF3427 domain-containing protein [Glaciibacter psychrotolerans]|uniref:Uncharacterized protein n=1 Tax=Glaciibacter psychrotolerans TaxID=670054 RepID=A0A7Z0EAS4_9MICO|nr:DUF3427 domain-containing protein [Leifsonia psychrotolerans]NYJ18222.1 hypothetical protein [Leifsonia psychrotolerans]